MDYDSNMYFYDILQPAIWKKKKKCRQQVEEEGRTKWKKEFFLKKIFNTDDISQPAMWKKKKKKNHP